MELRLARLRHGARLPGGLRRTFSCGLTAVTAVILPFFAGIGLLISVAVITCPLG